MDSRFATRFCAVVLGLLALCSCGGGEGGAGSGPPGGTTTPLAVSPTSVTVTAGAGVTFSVSGGRPPYTWTVTSGGGSVNSSGLYTAPAQAGSATLAVADSSGAQLTASITITAPLAIFPPSITIPAGSQRPFAFTARDGAGDYQFRVVSGPGSITTAGVFSAGSAGGATVLEVRDRAGGVATASVRSIFTRTNGPVYAAVSDGTSWYLGGQFSAANPYEAPGLAALETATALPNLACDLQLGFDGDVLAVVSDGSSIYVGGRFTRYRDTPTPGGLVSLDAATCRPLTTYFFDTDQAVETTALALSGTSLYIAAQTQRYRGFRVASSVGRALFRVQAASAGQFQNFAPDIIVPELQRILVTADAVYAGLYKLDPVTGARDPAFQLPFGSIINAYAKSGNTLYVGGFIDPQRGGLIRVDANTGAVDPSFPSGRVVDGFVNDMILSGGSLYLTGSFQHFGTAARAGLAKINAVTAQLDTNFQPAVSFAEVARIAGEGRALLEVAGSLYVAGRVVIPGSAASYRVVRLDATTGALDPAFLQPVGFNNLPLTLSHASGNIVVGGRFGTYGGIPVSNLARLNIATSAADAAFSGTRGPDGRIESMVLRDGALFIGGEFSQFDGRAAGNLAKVDAATGAVDAAFIAQGGTDQPIRALAADASGLFVGGEFVLYRGLVRFGLVKVSLADGVPVAGFVNGFSTPFVYAMALNGGYLYAASTAGTYGGSTNPPLARINSTSGALDVTFPDIGLSGAQRVAITFSGDIAHASVQGFPPGRTEPSSLVRFQASTGAFDRAFYIPQQQLAAPVYALRVVNGALYAAATPRENSTDSYGYYLARLDPLTGVRDASFPQPSATANGSIRVLESTGGDLWIGGEFTRYRGGRGRYFIPVDTSTGAAADP